ncbi:hypothetical protein A2U01_0064230, partial [Trifolium medium]|nr:hypothetical protein [Trifolium medium]
MKMKIMAKNVRKKNESLRMSMFNLQRAPSRVGQEN